MAKKGTYEQGMQDAIEMWGNLCGRKASCNECPIGIIKGDQIDCTEFAKQFPKKYVALLQEDKNNGAITYAEEYHVRFPASPLSTEELTEMGYCRRAIFEGYLKCDRPSTDCIACWNEQFIKDEDPRAVEEVDEDDEDL